MAQLITVFGAVLGFTIAVTGFFAFDISFLSALTIWAMSGPAAALTGFFLAGTDAAPLHASGQRAFDAAA